MVRISYVTQDNFTERFTLRASQLWPGKESSGGKLKRRLMEMQTFMSIHSITISLAEDLNFRVRVSVDHEDT